MKLDYRKLSGGALAVVLLGGAAWLRAEPAVHNVPPATQGGVVVGLCDGKTSTEVKGVTAEQMTPVLAKQVADQLMEEWIRKNPNANWDATVAQKDQKPKEQNNQNSQPDDKNRKDQKGGKNEPPPSPAAAQGQAGAPIVPSSVQTGTYSNYTNRDAAIWAEETRKFVLDGDGIFHDAKKLGSTIAMSCDMCHPNAANTHPETYPKYQVQLQRVALLRDMINWCLENPLKAPPLADDDPKMRALEAYIIAQRKGVQLEYGKH